MALPADDDGPMLSMRRALQGVLNGPKIPKLNRARARTPQSRRPLPKTFSPDALPQPQGRVTLTRTVAQTEVIMPCADDGSQECLWGHLEVGDDSVDDVACPNDDEGELCFKNGCSCAKDCYNKFMADPALSTARAQLLEGFARKNNQEKNNFVFQMIRASRLSEDGVTVVQGPHQNWFLGQPTCLAAFLKLMGVSKKRVDRLRVAIEKGFTEPPPDERCGEKPRDTPQYYHADAFSSGCMIM